MTEHKPGIHEAFLVKRKLKLAGLHPDQIAELEAKFGELIGVDRISFQANPMLMRVAYDASQTDMNSLLQLLAEDGVEPDAGWWTQFKLNWDRQIDDNIKANAKHQPHCCSKPPPGK